MAARVDCVPMTTPGCRGEGDNLPDDHILLASWRTGEKRSGELLFERHYASVRRFFHNKVATHVHRDLVQKTFLACVEAPERFEARSSFRTYLFGIAHHVLLDHLRKQHRGPGRECDVDQLVIADLVPGPDEAVHARREQRVLLKALRRLSLPLQVVLELQYWESLSNPEIAEILDWPVGTVKTRLRTARAALEELIAEMAGSPEALRSTMDTLQLWAERVRVGGAPLPDL
jgi:RNA polymerase sigma-70 factor (ECF subfamily)